MDSYLRQVLGGRRPIVVANRPPVDCQRSADGRERITQGGGGLVTAMAALARATDAVWVAAERGEADRRLSQRGTAGAPAEVVTEDGDHFKVAYVATDPAAYALYYNEISNPLLWFIQHYLWDLGRQPILDARTERAWRDGYVAVNEAFADRVVKEAERVGGPVLVLTQDYHLYCLPQLVRSRLPEARLQHFIHVPWPTPQYWKVLPRHMRDAIVTGLLGNDIVGLQTSLDVRNFLLTCEENLGLAVDHRERTVFVEGRSVWVRSYPISIDVPQLEQLTQHEEVRRQEQLIASWRPEHLILRVDRTDLSKNIVRGFLAYERLLETHPELRGRVVFWAFLQRSRQNVDAYRSYLGAVVGTAAQVNRRFQSGGWMPIRLEVEENIYKAVAAYKSFDALLVNPIYDGMNLVAKEGVVCNTRGGVLVLSENAGCHEELGRFALTVNPFDIDQTAEALRFALMLPQGERQHRLQELSRTVRHADVTRWITQQLQDLRDLVGD
ncbi:MAG TPA: trehalose-6-phosphate synthase [Verrucomicrobiae bacterium]|nr:trehalose-6-phosphate synthase [Verrucomicrobiae bacterium]